MKPSRLLPLLVACGLTFTIVAPMASSAAPIDDLQTQARRIQDQIDTNGAQISAMAEEYNAARLRLDQANAAIASAQAAIKAAEARMAKLQGAINTRAAQIYMQGGLPVVDEEFDPTQPTEFGTKSKYAQIAARTDKQAINELNDVRDQLKVRRIQLDEARARAEDETQQIAAKRQSIENANAEQSRILAQVKGDLARAVAAEEERRRAEEERLARQTISNGGNNGGGNGGTVEDPSPPPPPPPSGGAAAAIAYARAQLGKPYVYAAAGPDTFDCSGLTMRAWGSAGVSMPHYSGAQYAMFPHVPLDQLQPGDLVFRGPGGSRHVMLYIGGGMVIHAPQTGDVVKIAPMGSVMGAARPG